MITLYNKQVQRTNMNGTIDTMSPFVTLTIGTDYLIYCVRVLDNRPVRVTTQCTDATDVLVKLNSLTNMNDEAFLLLAQLCTNLSTCEATE